jgi:TetR/AcrR family transcriptional regulator
MTRRRRDSRALIEDAARTEFAEHGFAGARVARIAMRAAVNKQLIFYYFGSKVGLYKSVVGETEPEAFLPPSPPPSDPGRPAGQLRDTILQLFRTLASRPELARLVISDAQDRHRGRNLWRQVLDGMRSRISRIVSEGQGLGYFRDDVDPDRFAEMGLLLPLASAAIGGMQQAEQPGDAARIEWERNVTELLIRSLTW